MSPLTATNAIKVILYEDNPDMREGLSHLCGLEKQETFVDLSLIQSHKGPTMILLSLAIAEQGGVYNG